MSITNWPPRPAVISDEMIDRILSLLEGSEQHTDARDALILTLELGLPMQVLQNLKWAHIGTEEATIMLGEAASKTIPCTEASTIILRRRKAESQSCEFVFTSSVAAINNALQWLTVEAGLGFIDLMTIRRTFIHKAFQNVCSGDSAAFVRFFAIHTPDLH